MKIVIPRTKAIWTAVEIALILILHVVLIHVLAEKDIAATILSAGPHAPKIHLLAAGGFVLVRLLAVLLLPGIILNRLALFALEHWTRGGVPEEAEVKEAEGDAGSQDQA